MTDRQGVRHNLADKTSARHTDKVLDRHSYMQGRQTDKVFVTTDMLWLETDKVLDIQIDEVLDRHTYRQTRCWTD